MNDTTTSILIPEKYTISLTPDLKEFTFSGEETIVFTTRRSTKTITLHAVDISVVSAQIRLEKGFHIEDASVGYDTEKEEVMFTFKREVPVGTHELHITFTGLIHEQLKGWYRSGYSVNGEKRYMATSHFEEIDARRLFPCVDDPAAKAIFIFSVTISKDLQAISNMPEETTTEESEIKTITFQPTPKMSTYPLVLIVGEFESIEEIAENGVLVRLFVVPGKIHQAEFALKTAAKMLVYYEKYFGIKYPLPKLDFIAVPDFDAGAMENWGAVTAREAAILLDEEKSAAVTKQWVATVIAHEISHMWFGDLVTLKWWTYLWLNEGFASYMEYLAVDEFFPEWNVWEQFAILDHNRALALDALDNTHAVETEVKDIKKIAENFDPISYSKGASVIYMLAAFLGEDKFQKGVQHYLKKYAYANATTEDLWNSFEEVSGKPVKEIMHSFVREPGHPVITARVTKDLLELSQKRFFSSQISSQGSKNESKWKIPFAISSSDTSLGKEYLMRDKKMTIPQLKNSDWVKINSQETSFVRVIYSRDLYTRLKKPISDNSLSPIDRTGIIRDAFDAAEAGYFSTVSALDLVKAYEKESSYIVWSTLAGKLAKIASLLAETELSSNYYLYARKIVENVASTLGWEKKPTDTHQDILLRSISLYFFGKYGDKKTLQYAHKLFTEFVEKNKKIDNDMRGTVYRLVAQNGGQKEFEILKKMYIEEELHEEKNRLGNALVSFQNPEIVEKALDFSLTDDVRHQDIGRFILLGFDNEKGREATWKFVRKNWDYLRKIHEGQVGMDWLIDGAANFTTEEKKEEIKEFFVNNPTPQLLRTIDQVLEHIESNIAWLKRDLNELTKFLDNTNS